MVAPRSFRRLAPSSLVASMVAIGVGVVRPAAGHGRFPGSGAVVFDATNQNHLVVRTTFGLYDNPDASRGPSEGWRWLCSNAIGYDADKEDPALTFAGDRLVVGTFDGLVVASADRCSFAVVPEVAGRYVVDLAALPSADAPREGSPILALASNGVAEDVFDVKLFESTDGAASWRSFGAALPKDFLALGVLAAPSANDPLAWGTIYLSGRDGRTSEGYHAVVMRSDDGGATWVRHAVPGIDGVETLPYLQGVLQADGMTVFAAAVRDLPPQRSQRNLVSRDGGATWNTYFSAEELLPAFGLSPDQTKVAFGGAKTGLRVAPIDALEEPGSGQQVAKTRVSCLSWRTDGLYACANAFVDGFTVGRSDDEGASFEPVSYLTSACGALECAPGTVVGDTCPALWPKEALELVAPRTCVPEPAMPPEADAGCECTASRSRGFGKTACAFAVVAALVAVVRRRSSGRA